MVMSSNQKSSVQCSLQLALELFSKLQLVRDYRFWKELLSHLSHQQSPYWQVQIMNAFILLRTNRKKIFGNLECKFFKVALSLHPLFKFRVVHVPKAGHIDRIIWTKWVFCVTILIKVLIGALGLVGFLLRFVGPLTIAPVLIQIGISLTMPAVDYCKGNWAVAIIVMFVLILCMEILARFAIPIPGYNFKEKKCT